MPIAFAAGVWTAVDPAPATGSPLRDRASDRRRVGTPGSFGVFLDGVVVASLVRSGPHHGATWTAELLRDLDQKDRSPPFRRLEHQFATFEEARDWLGNPEIASEL
jgi:hypothetical protein